jgi:hypothetical protein
MRALAVAKADLLRGMPAAVLLDRKETLPPKTPQADYRRAGHWPSSVAMVREQRRLG